MTRIIFIQYKEMFSLEIKGHAEYNPGNDIVCSAISALTFALAQTITNEEDRGNLEQMRIELEEGNAIIECKCKPNTFERVEMAFKTILNGYELIADKYPNNVVINTV